jgi:two-component system, sensor histidine kinase LadS
VSCSSKHGAHPGWRLLASALLCVALVLATLPTAHAGEAGTIVLDPAHPQFTVASALGWFGPRPGGGIHEVTDGRLPFAALSLQQAVRFREDSALWLKLRLQPVPGNTEVWELEVPVAVIDLVVLYQQDAGGRWIASSAGDLVPRHDWPLAGRYPFFRLQLRPDRPTDLYVQVRNATTLPLPLRIVTAAVHNQRALIEYLALGIFIGALALLVLASLVRAVLLRDAAYVWFAAYALVAMLALAAFTGVAAHLLWGNAGGWVDTAPACLALLGGSLVVVIVRRLSGAVARVRRRALLFHLVAVVGIVLALAYPLLERELGLVLLGMHLVCVATLNLYAAIMNLRRKDPVGRWMLCGAVPLSIAVALAMARSLGWLPASWITEYALVLALTIDLPMLFGALNSRSHERRSVELRRLASASQDPLTGLLRRGPFVARLHQALARHERRGEGAAIAVIDVVNHDWIQKTRGAEAAEEALLRTVIKLRRLVRDVDTTGRVGETRFGLILEGVAMRRPMMTVATRLVAAGLMEEPDAPRDTVLHFHVAAVVLAEHRAPAEQLLQALGKALDTMSPRTRRPLRFLEADGVASAPDVLSPTAEPGSDASPATA